MSHVNDKIGKLFADAIEYLRDSDFDKSKVMYQLKSLKGSVKKILVDEDIMSKIESKLEGAVACKFKTGKQLKRMDGGWEVRYDWELTDANNKVMCVSQWEGFLTLKEALNDLYKNIK